MADKMTLILLLVAGFGVIGGVVYWLLQSKGGDVRNIDSKTQDRLKNQISSRPTVSKTAQLSALRERLADAQTSSTGLKKINQKTSDGLVEQEKSWRPEDAGLDDSSILVGKKPGENYNGGGASVIKTSEVELKKPSQNVEVLVSVSELPVERPVIIADTEAKQGSVIEKTVSNPIEVHLKEVTPVVNLPQASNTKDDNDLNNDLKKVTEISAVHILLVDDSKVVRVKTEKLLSNKGYKVTTAIDGIDALAKLETLRPSLIITDIEMPNLDGFGLVRNVRGNLRTAEIPVIVMTSHVNLHLDIAATEGINGFLPKPFNDQDLLDQVAFLCES